MSDMELRSLTPKMRGLVGEISDADVAHYPSVVAATAEVTAVRAADAIPIGARNESEANIEKVEVSIAEVTEQINAIDGARPALALEIFEGTRSDDEDRTTQGELQELRRRLDQLQLVLAGFRGQYERACHETSRPSRATSKIDAERKLEDARFQAKLALARSKDE
jgi:hypothetical protein